MSNQFGRKGSLIVAGGSAGLDLSEFRFTFEVRQSDVQTPNTAFIRVYNLKPTTVAKIKGEFTRVVLQAGYETGNFGIIFDGTIKQYRTGKERNVDSYIDILAADGDIAYNNSIVNTTLAAGASQQDIVAALTSSFMAQGVPLASDANGLIGGVNPQALSRGKVMFGMTRSYMRDWSDKNGFRWSIQNGQVVVVPITGYRPGEAAKLNSNTGMIGVPEATEDGVHVRCLLNPLIRVGALVQIDNKDIANTTLLGQIGINYAPQYAASVTNDGFYRVLVCEFQGDSRGQAWYSDLTCLAVDVSAINQSNSVQAAG